MIIPSRRKSMKTSLDVASFFIKKDYERSTPSITQKKLQKLVYYAQAWSLVFLDRPLFDGELQAWRHGAVELSLRSEFKNYTYKTLPKPNADETDWTPEGERVLDEVWKTYGALSADELEELNHNEMPWLNARGNFPPRAKSQTPISEEELKFYYSHFVEDREKYKIGSSALKMDKKMLVELVTLDGNVHFVDRDDAENFIIQNLGNFDKKKFQPRRPRRNCFQV